MDTFTQQIINLFNANKQDTISALNKNNAEYADLRKRLSKDVSQDIEQLKEDMHRIYDIESETLYLQGFKDCIRLLRFIEIL